MTARLLEPMPVLQELPEVTRNRSFGAIQGGFTTKIHAITDGLGNPLEFILTGGQATDVGQAEALLQFTPAGTAALLSEGYDSDAFIQAIQDRKMQAVIPPRSSRPISRDCD